MFKIKPLKEREAQESPGKAKEKLKHILDEQWTYTRKQTAVCVK